MLLFMLPAMANPFPDLATPLSRVSCEAPTRTKIRKRMPGAEQFYSGAFRLDESGNLVGIERRYTYANAMWEAAEGIKKGRDCVDVWNVKGKKAPVNNCEDCAFGLTFQADIDVQKTTCERRLTADGNHFRTSYDVKTNADGTFELFFASGKPLAKGKMVDGDFAWITPQGCVWF